MYAAEAFVMVGDFFCEACDRPFNSSLKYAEHVAEHETCGLEGCTFTAHPKVVAKHVQLQHLSGLFSRIGRMDSPEDISKWIANRKRHYPTRENIERMQAEHSEKLQRGERLMKDSSRFNREVQNRYRGRGHNKRGRGRGRSRFSQGRREYGFEIKNEDDLEDQEEELKTFRGKLRLFPGTQILEDEQIMNCTNEVKMEVFSDSEWEACDKVSLETPTIPIASRALSSLMCTYASGASDSENDEPLEIPILKTASDLNSETVGADSKKCFVPISSYKSPVCENFVPKETTRPDALGAVAEVENCSQLPDSNQANIEEHNLTPIVENFVANTNNIVSPMCCSETLESDHLVTTESDGKVALINETEVQKYSRVLDESHSQKSSALVLDHNSPLVLEEPEDISSIPDRLSESVHEMASVSSSVNQVEMLLSQNDYVDGFGRTKRDHAENGNTEYPKSRSEYKRDIHNSVQRRFNNNTFQGPYIKRRRKTLLEKLLAKEILHERNVILQCVRYVVENKFFGVGQNASKNNSLVMKETHLSNVIAQENRKNNVLLQSIKYIVRKNFFDVSKSEK